MLFDLMLGEQNRSQVGCLNIIIGFKNTALTDVGSEAF